MKVGLRSTSRLVLPKSSSLSTSGAIGGATWLATSALYARLFQKTFGFTARTLPLFVFIAGSPFFLKNFMHTLGHFDIYVPPAFNEVVRDQTEFFVRVLKPA